jgi:pre-mRNA-processing factor SLU7
VDVESGKMINPHNPEYITKRPWYLGESGPSLNHHAVQKKDHLLSLHEADVVAASRKKKQPKNARLVVGMWVEGLKHGKTPWLQAKVHALNLDGSADLEFEDGKVCKKVKREHVKTAMAFGSMVGIEQEGKLAFDAKRDRWHGYDPSAHKLTVDRYC